MHAITIVLLFRTRLLRFRQLYKEMPCAVRSNLGGPSELARGVARQPHATEEEASLRSGKKPSAFRELEAVVNLRLAWRRRGGGRRHGLNPWPEEGGSCQGRSPPTSTRCSWEGRVPLGVRMQRRCRSQRSATKQLKDTQSRC